MRHDPVTVVEWHLEPTAGGTRVTLVNSGWPDAAAMSKVDTTWKGILQNLKSVVETGDVPGRQKMTLFFMRTFMSMMPASTRTENVVVPD